MKKFMLAINSDDLTRIVAPVIEVCENLVPVLLILVGAIGSLWCIFLGVKYIKAVDQQEHDQAKKALINSIIGFIAIFVLLIGLKVATGVFTDWWSTYDYVA
jgi:heme O synthase-like polyprenyltransferase